MVPCTFAQIRWRLAFATNSHVSDHSKGVFVAKSVAGPRDAIGQVGTCSRSEWWARNEQVGPMSFLRALQQKGACVSSPMSPSRQYTPAARQRPGKSRELGLRLCVCAHHLDTWLRSCRSCSLCSEYLSPVRLSVCRGAQQSQRRIAPLGTTCSENKLNAATATVDLD